METAEKERESESREGIISLLIIFSRKKYSKCFKILLFIVSGKLIIQLFDYYWEKELKRC